jgi:hypothetical protein
VEGVVVVVVCVGLKRGELHAHGVPVPAFEMTICHCLWHLTGIYLAVQALDGIGCSDSCCCCCCCCCLLPAAACCLLQVCALCCLRMRLCYRDTKCPLCKTEAKQVIDTGSTHWGAGSCMGTAGHARVSFAMHLQGC